MIVMYSLTEELTPQLLPYHLPLFLSSSDAKDAPAGMPVVHRKTIFFGRIETRTNCRLPFVLFVRRDQLHLCYLRSIIIGIKNHLSFQIAGKINDLILSYPAGIPNPRQEFGTETGGYIC